MTLFFISRQWSFISRYSTNQWFKCKCQILYSYLSECIDEICSSESLLWVSSSYQAHLPCAGFACVNGSLSYFLNELCSLIYSQVHGNPSRLEDDQVGLCWGGEGVDALGKLLIKNKSFVLFGHLHTSVFDTLKHPWIMDRMLRVCYSSFETPGN